MGSAAEFLISIEQQLRGDDAASELQRAENAVRDGIAAYKQLEAASGRTDLALGKVSAQLSKVRTSMESAMKAGDAAAFWKMAGAADELAAKEAQLQAAAAKAKTALQAQEKAVTSAGDAMAQASAQEQQLANAPQLDTQKTAQGIKKLGGPLGSVGDKVEEFSESWEALHASLGGVGAAAAIAVVAIVAIGAALVAGLAKLGAWAVGLADTRRNLGLTLEAVLESKDAAVDMSAAFSDVGHSTGVGSDRLLELTRELKKAKVAAADMPTALEALATQEAALGDTGGTAELIKQLETGQKSVDALSQEMGDKYGDIVDRQGKSLSRTGDELKRNLGEIFGGLDIEPLLAGLADAVGLLDTTTGTGYALKTMFETLFQPLLDAVVSTIPYAQLFFVKFINTILRIAVAVKPAVTALSELFGVDPSDSMTIVMDGARVAATALAVAVGAVVVAIGAVALAALQIGRGFMAAYNLAATAWNAIKAAVNAGKEAIAAVDLEAVGKDLIDGLVKGVKAGMPKVASAFGLVGQVAEGALRTSTETKSPSKLFERLGYYQPEGFALGIESGTPLVERAITGMVGTGGEMAKPVAGKGRGGSLTVESIVINIHGTSEEDMPSRVRGGVIQALEEAALELGLDLVPT
mgnify:CR=1 FL=1